MALFYQKIDDEFSIADNMDFGAPEAQDRRRRFTSVSKLYCIHILSGTCRLDINGYEVSLEKNDFLALIQGSFIRTEACSEDLKYCCMAVRYSVFLRLFDEVGFNLAAPERIHKFYKSKCSEEHHLNQLRNYKYLKNRVISGSVFDMSIARRILEAMFLKDMELYWAFHPQALQRPGRKEQVFYDFMKLVEVHYLSERSLAFYADALGLTSKYLSAVIKEVSGKHFTYWIDEPLITEAKKMLYYTKKSIRQISDELGFVDQSKFGRFFKNITGFSPRQFRSLEEDT